MSNAMATSQPTLVHAIDPGAGRPRLSRAAVIAIAGSLAAHVVVGIYLYEVRYGAPPIIDTSPPPSITLINDPLKQQPPPPKPPPQTVKRTLVIHDSHAPPTTSTPPLPLAPTPLNLRTNDKLLPPLPDPGPTQPAPSGPPQITQPDWVSLPGPKEFSRWYPQAAIDRDASGAVRLTCTVAADGAVHDCQTTAETPQGLGFAAAAQKLVPYFRMRPLTRDGTPVDGASITIPIRFNLG